MCAYKNNMSRPSQKCLARSCRSWIYLILQELARFLKLLTKGYINSLEWSGGMEYWSGVLDWTGRGRVIKIFV